MRVVVVPCLKDNFAYLVIDEAAGIATVVDPGEGAPVLAAVAREGVRLTAVWATHHHADHVGGIEALVAAVPGLAVIGFRGDAARIPGVTALVDDDGEVTLGAIRARIIHNPGHTLGAISYVIDAVGEAPGAVFTGDTLFAAGCGRLFEGTPAQMHASLSRLAALPAATRVYFGHEYTAANLRFAAAVEPGSAEIAARAAGLDTSTRPSTPSTIGEERVTNPFLRASEPGVIAAAAGRGVTGGAVEVFGAIREWKNTF
jgi:hydroxyacylglutathione hydrolase